MRYEKKVVVLVCTLAALLVIWGAGIVFSPDRVTARAEAGSILAAKPEAVQSISLGGGDAPLSLVRQANAWYLEDGAARFPVQTKRVSSFLEALAAVKRLRPLAHSRDAWAGFGLDEGKAKSILVQNAGGAHLVDIQVGGYGPTGSEVYIRRAGSDESYAADASFAAYLDYGRSGWLDLQLLPQLPETDVESISVHAAIALDGPGKPPLAIDYRLTRSGQGWSGLAAGVESSAADALLRSVLALEAVDYVASPPSNSFEPVTARIELSLGAGGSKVLEIGRPVPAPASAQGTKPGAAPAAAAASGLAPSEGRFYARVAGSPYVSVISAYSLHTVLKTPADLLPKK